MGPALTLHTAELDTPVGRLRVTVGASGLRRVRWTDPEGDPVPADDRTAPVVEALAAWFAGRRTDLDVPVELVGLSDLQERVLRTLHETVAFGRTVTYGELAERSGTGVPARAIGALMGANPVPIVIPCHRVLAADGLGGYSGGYVGPRAGGGTSTGRAVKQWLLRHEGSLQDALF